MVPGELRCFSGGNEAFDPAGEFGDSCVNPIIVRPPQPRPQLTTPARNQRPDGS